MGLAQQIAHADEPQTIQQKWQSSPHANSESESFRHWDDDGEVPTNCAACHSMGGFLDYIGADGSSVGTTDKGHPTDTVVACDTCHNDKLAELPAVSFPSGAAIADTGSSTSCMICHQGRSSTISVNAALDTLAEDSVSTELQFLNIHYRAAAATLLGSAAQGGYEYAGKTYAGKFAHPAPLDSCAGCHDPHTLSVSAQDCSGCHSGVTEERISAIRTTDLDIDGDGDSMESIADELSDLHEKLNDVIALYGQNISNAAIVYDAHTYPYFFNDSNANGAPDSDESIYPNRYQSWTPRLLKAAYNYQFFAKDPGAWAHNPHYTAQLLIDSIEDITSTIELDVPDHKRP